MENYEVVDKPWTPIFFPFNTTSFLYRLVLFARCHFAALLQTFASHEKFNTHSSLHKKRFQLK